MAEIPLPQDPLTMQIQERLKALHTLTKEIDEERKKSDVNITSLMKAKEKNNPEEKRSSSQSLKKLLKTAISDTQREEELLRKALDKITEIRGIRNEYRIQARNAGNTESIRRGARMQMVHSNAQTLPLFVGKPGEKSPPLCGAVPADPNYIAKVGDMVAALVKVNVNEENWILAEVVSYDSVTNKYEVDDIDEEDKDIHVLSHKHVIPLPLMRANPETDPSALFPKGAEVMAIFHSTTCFYPAIVHQAPMTHLDDYELLFEDNETSSGYSLPTPVIQSYVIAAQ